MNKREKLWQQWKLNQPGLNEFEYSVLIGMVISDANVNKHGKYAYVKFEQSKNQYFFIHHLWSIFKKYTFMNDIGVRLNKNQVKSFYFKTYTHPAFLEIYNLFYTNKKDINVNIINNLNEISLAYWIMGDGSFNQRDKILSLHTENYSKETNILISSILNEKFNIHSYITLSNRNNKIYYVINIPRRDKDFILYKIKPFILKEFKYKINY